MRKCARKWRKPWVLKERSRRCINMSGNSPQPKPQRHRPQHRQCRDPSHQKSQAGRIGPRRRLTPPPLAPAGRPRRWAGVLISKIFAARWPERRARRPVKKPNTDRWWTNSTSRFEGVRHLSTTIRLRQVYDTVSTPFLQAFYQLSIPFLHRFYRFSISFLYRFYTISTGFLSAFYTVSTGFLSAFYTVSTGFLSAFYTVSTPFLHRFYRLSISFLYRFYRFSTGFLHHFYRLSISVYGSF